MADKIKQEHLEGFKGYDPSKMEKELKKIRKERLARIRQIKKEKLARIEEENKKIKQDPLLSFPYVKVKPVYRPVKQEKLASFKEIEPSKDEIDVYNPPKPAKLIGFQEVEILKETKNMKNNEKEVQE